jgi:hypothetical protein
MSRTHIPVIHVPKPKKPKSRLQRGGSIKPVSAKRARLNKVYSALRKKFLAEHPWCEFFLEERGWDEGVVNELGVVSNHGTLFCPVKVPRSADVHHKKGRGRYLLDTSTWMAVSREGHLWIHANPKESYEKGYMLPR